MNRTGRFLAGVSLGYLHIALVTAVGLWLTPFLLGRIGQHDYALWLVAAQIVGYLALLDFGLIALLPREIAHASGMPDGARATAAVFYAFRRLVLRQLPLVAAAVVATWWWLPQPWAELRRPLVLVLAAFAAMFPLRVYQAALQGLQDLAFLGRVQLLAWGLGTATLIGLVLAGAGLYALMAGWIVTQVCTAAAAMHRARSAHAGVLAREPGALTPGRGFQRAARWLGLSQVAQVLLSGSDVLVLAAVLPPAAIVPYVCTTRLGAIFANQPYLLGNTALPALTQIRASRDTERLLDVALALSQGVLLLSGLVAGCVLVGNAWFVTWWVGPALFAGVPLTLLAVLAMVLRHAGFMQAQLLFCLGRQRALSLTAISDGVVAVALTAALAQPLGIIAAPLAQVAAVSLITLPVHTWLLHQSVGAILPRLVPGVANLGARIALGIGAAAALAWAASASGSLLTVGAAELTFLALYGALTLPVLLRDPTLPYVARLVSLIADRSPATGRLMNRFVARAGSR